MTTIFSPFDDTAPEPTTAVVNITPDLAREWLGRNVQNRNIRRRKVEMYARTMAAGQWAITNQGIGFDRAGTLVDGQHRLHAIIEANIPVRMNVTKNLAPTARSHIDTGASRTTADILSVNHGTKNAAIVAAVAKRAVAWDRGFRWLHNYDPAPEEIEAYVIDPSHDLLHRAAYVGSYGRKYVPAPPSLVAFTYYLCARQDAEAAETFFVDQLIEGIALNATDPAKVLSKWLAHDAHIKGTTAEFRKLAAIIHAWNLYRAGKQVQRLTPPKGAGWNSENFPEPR